MQPAVDLDGIATWPPAVRDFAEHWATALDGTRVACDLVLSETAQDSFVTLIGDRPIRAYHSTRLLEEEATAIRSQGLIPLAEELVISRVLAAHASCHLTAAERDAILSESIFAYGKVPGAEGRYAPLLDAPSSKTILRLWTSCSAYGAERLSTGLTSAQP